jgi:hypothetical protein
MVSVRDCGREVEGMKRLCAVFVAALALAALAGAPAFGGTTDFNDDTWQGEGLPEGGCPDGATWVLFPAFGVPSATLTVDGTQYTMTPSGAPNTLTADSTGPVTSATVATAQWVNVPDQDDSDAELSVSGCVSGSTTTGSTTGGTTGSTTGGTTSGTTGSGGVSGQTTGGTGGTTGGVAGAAAGGNLPFTGLPVWIPLLVSLGLLASGYLLLRRKARGPA